MIKTFACALGMLVAHAALPYLASSAEFMFRARVDGKMLEGQPLSWSQTQMLLLGRDGRLYDFNPQVAKEAAQTSPRFFGYSSSEMKTQLQQEFGKQFDVSATRHYLVVHPQGERDQWAGRFEDLYKRFEHYFRVRGFSLEDLSNSLIERGARAVRQGGRKVNFLRVFPALSRPF